LHSFNSDDRSSDDSDSIYSHSKSNFGIDMFDMNSSVESVFELQFFKASNPVLKRRRAQFAYRQQNTSAKISWRYVNGLTLCDAGFFTDYGRSVFRSKENPRHNQACLA
jgi:hypothetical protein